MDQATESIPFEPETEFMIGKMRFIVTAHYDDTQDSMQAKIARLLKNAVSQLPNPEKYDIIAA